MIAGLQATSQWYADAIDLMGKCFGDPSALIQGHMQRLIDIKPVASATNVRELRRMFDCIQVHMRGLEALDFGEESYEAMLYPVLLHTLPRELVLN
ncbi:hypothetical protein HPB49_009640 [Dermacentor silvarum]|uniref:Uncharacterized protein n=1 Tax=Dermacentor silvarum TaxID=543639 RepID=A0ACB8C2U0_DERSI|nr:hypothetical protein HPB49_009640 [Dermacentor silvarum]